MYEYLVVRFCEGVIAPHAAAEWMLLGRDSRGARVQSGELTDVGDFYTSLAEKPVVVVLAPARDVLLTEVAVPEGQQRYAKQALPFLVEEKLADDIEDVHIAMGPLQKNDPVPVAVARHFDVINWLDALYSVGLPTTWLVPEQLALPWVAGSTRLYLERQGCLLRNGYWQGMGCDLQTLGIASIAMLKKPAADVAPTQVEIAYSHDAGLDEDADKLRGELQEALGIQPRLLAYKEGTTEVLARNVIAHLSDNINLLQGGYAVQTPGLRGTLNWRALSTTFASCLLLYLALTAGTGLWFSLQADALEEQAVAQYREWFPEARRVFDPRRQLHSKLANGQVAGSELLLSYIGAVATDWRQESDMRLQAMDYQAQSGSMTLQLAAPAAEDMASLQQQLQARGLQSELKSVSQRGELVTGRLELGALYP